eukprot:GEMP01104760.1.p1 GENE.GEMP01104760.1~~GEMP01104760.1.p1  ORF type:complete len:130 (+),score=33.28 GEMP01104760.1:354-743(+)
MGALMLFRGGVRPEWESPLNATGGHFQYHLKPSLGGGQVDEYWNNLVLGIIGATIEPVDLITGVRLVDKLQCPRSVNAIRLEVWFMNYDDANTVALLKRNLDRCMGTRMNGEIIAGPKCEVKPHIVQHQ